MADTCRGCAQPITWALTEKGRRIPLDPTPTPKGNVRVEARERGPVAVIVPVGSEPELRTSHFATCSFAPRFRKRGAA